MCLGKRRGKIFRIISVGLVCTLLSSYVFPPEAFASRSNAGGGKIAKFNIGDVVASAAIGVGSLAIGGALNAGLSSALGRQGTSGAVGAMGNSLRNSFSLSGIARGYNTFVAVSQVGRAAGMMGAYYKWSPNNTFLISSVASGAVGGFLNPAPVLGDAMVKTDYVLKPVFASGIAETTRYVLVPVTQPLSSIAMNTMLKGAFVGSVTSLANVGTMIAIDGGKINKGKEPGIGSQIAGIVAGVGVGNFARALVNPQTYQGRIYGTYKQAKDVANPAIKMNQDLAQQQTGLAGKSAMSGLENLGASLDRAVSGDFSGAGDSISAAGGDFETMAGHLTKAEGYTQTAKQIATTEPYSVYEITQKDPFTGKETAVPVYDLEQRYADSTKYVFRPVAGDYFEVYQPHAVLTSAEISGRLLDATFVKTLDMWPQLVTRSLSIAATSFLNKSAPVVSSVVEGVAGPFISGVADYFALRPGLYLGERHIQNSVQYVDQMKQLAYMDKVGKVGEGLYHELEKGGNLVELRNRFQAVLNAQGLGQIEVPNVTKPEDMQRIAEADYKDAVKGNVMTPEDATKALGDLEKSIAKDNARPETTLMDITKNRASLAIQAAIKGAKTLDDAFRAAGTSRDSLFLTNLSRDKGFGLIEGAISGGISSLANKVSDNNPLTAGGIAYGATLLTGAIRGAVWYAKWEEEGDVLKNLIWMNKYHLYEPQRYKGDNWIDRTINDYAYIKELEIYKEFGEASGLEAAPKPRTTFNITATDVKTQEESVRGYELEFFNKKPSLEVAVLASMAQANRDFVNRAFSFGTPQTKPEYVNSLILVDYLNSLRGYAGAGANPGWLTSGLTFGYINAGTYAISNNILTTLAAIKPVTSFVGMQRQRFVLTNPPTTPFTVQALDYQPWFIAHRTRFYLPFPSDSYRAGSRTGRSFIREGK